MSCKCGCWGHCAKACRSGGRWRTAWRGSARSAGEWSV